MSPKVNAGNRQAKENAITKTAGEKGKSTYRLPTFVRGVGIVFIIVSIIYLIFITDAKHNDNTRSISSASGLNSNMNDSSTVISQVSDAPPSTANANFDAQRQPPLYLHFRSHCPKIDLSSPVRSTQAPTSFDNAIRQQQKENTNHDDDLIASDNNNKRFNHFKQFIANMSWVQYLPDHPFPIQNLPFGVFTSAANPTEKHIATAIGDYVVDLNVLANAGLFADASVAAALKEPTMNTYMSLGYDKWKQTREVLTSLFSKDCPTLQNNTALRAQAMLVAKDCQMHLPATIGDYTDFYASKEHASNLGKLFRPGQPPLMENWLTIPVGYHGRASSIVISGTGLRRPVGQRKPDADKPSVVGASMAFDIELEMAAWIGTGNNLGDRISTAEARKAVFGYSLFNDWSARDIQKYEYVPLGPFLGKNFGSTIGAWIVTTFALEPFQVAGPEQDPAPLPYLKQSEPGNYNVNLYVTLTTKEGESQVISTTNYKYMYWSAHQMIAHHTVNGCNLRPGDVLASGTISGPTAGSYGSMLELTWQGTNPIKLPSGAERKMLLDGDSISLAGECVGDGYRIGFGDCIGTVLPALPLA